VIQYWDNIERANTESKTNRERERETEKGVECRKCTVEKCRDCSYSINGNRVIKIIIIIIFVYYFY